MWYRELVYKLDVRLDVSCFIPTVDHKVIGQKITDNMKWVDNWGGSEITGLVNEMNSGIRTVKTKACVINKELLETCWLVEELAVHV